MNRTESSAKAQAVMVRHWRCLCCDTTGGINPPLNLEAHPLAVADAIGTILRDHHFLAADLDSPCRQSGIVVG